MKSKVFFIVSTLILSLAAISCKNTGELTGVGGPTKENQKKIFKFLKTYKAYSLIPSTTIMQYNPSANKMDTIHIPTFFIFNEECSNINWKEFVYYIKRNHGLDSAKKLMPDTSLWKNYNEPLQKLYFQHSAYRDYPVVGITHAQAESYCLWLNEIFAMKTDLPFKKVSFSLPTEAEWEYAAKGGLAASPYPWGGPYVQNAKGEYLANFRRIDQGSVYRDSLGRLSIGNNENSIYANSAISTTAPVSSYNPNGYGLFNMSGNVEEMIKKEGIAKGGSWMDPGYYLQISVRTPYPSGTGNIKRGFRVVMHVEEY